ncbi:2-oxo acid dehydrogenase subunit E2 [Mesorhizobium sp.]|uniref:2-oxo acid dehydrogenase subunit E2 n=1 Tax=Mesorhizobium sp. TaxID=1871066 RepID=UPI000FEA30B1|nr:MAG: hypothetical protein EOR23_33690 [Mesorhizobium sp.]TIP88295.1 MAG: hypothetical protein E5X58_28535 [Mesorhizobium sp.]
MNAPRCAILTVGSAAPRGAVDRVGKMAVAMMLTSRLSVDHRARCADASKFLKLAGRHLRPESVGMLKLQSCPLG